MKDKRNKQLQTALTNLEEAQLVQLPRRQASRGAYEGFVLLDERGGRTYGDPLEYVVPAAREAVFHIPAEMITNGWIHVLEDTEIALLLMTACGLGSITDGQAVAIPSGVRLLHYGLGRDAFEAHRMLTRLGLLSVDEQARYDDGRAVDYTDEGAQLHRLRLLQGGFAQDGWLTMTATIESILNRDSNYSRQASNVTVGQKVGELDAQGFGAGGGAAPAGNGRLDTTQRLRMPSRSMKRSWLRLAASKALPIQALAALVISPPATMKA